MILSRMKESEKSSVQSGFKYRKLVSLMSLLFISVKNALLYVLCSFGLFIMAFLVLCSGLKLLAIKIVLKIFYGESFEILSGTDAALQFVQANDIFRDDKEVSIHCVTICRGHVDLREFSELARERLIEAHRQPGRNAPKVFPRLTQRIVRKFGYYVWIEDRDFSIDHHFQLHDQTYTDEASLIQIVHSIVNTPLPKTHSPWVFVYVPKVALTTTVNQGPETCAGEQFALVVKCHHSLCDGLGVMRTLQALSDESCQRQMEELKKKLFTGGNLLPVIKNNPLLRYFASKRKGLTLTEKRDIALNIFHMLLWAPWWHLEQAIHREHNAFHGPALSGQVMVAVTEQLHFQLFRDIALAFKCTINAVYLCCLGGSFNRCDRNATNIRVVMPMALLPPDATYTQNGVAVTLFDLPLQIKSAENRINAYARILKRATESPRPIVYFATSQVIGNHLPVALAKLAYHAASYTVMASNVAGPPFEAILGGRTMTDHFTIPSTASIGFSFISYNGSARIGVSVDEAVTTDDLLAQKLANGCVKELKIFHAMTKGNMETGQI